MIDRAVLDLLKIDEDTALEITTDGQSLVVAPVRDEKRCSALSGPSKARMTGMARL